MRRDNTTTERIATFSDGMIAVIITIMVLELKAPEDPKLSAILSLTELAALPVAIYAAIFVLVNGAYVFFEREALLQADATTMTGHARRLAHRRSLAGLTIFALASVAAAFEPFAGFALICLALLLYLRPEIFMRHHNLTERSSTVSRRSPP
jgi:uncharacterized membrane protein